MIGEYKGKVKNKVITALFQAYQDTLDYDGLKSILREAELLDLRNKTDLNPNDTIDFFIFMKIISAQNCLLFCCDDLLQEIGKNFSFYLFPYGKSFEDIISEMNDLIQTDWKVEIIERTEDLFTVKVENCVFCSQIGISCDFFVGFLINSLQKSLQSEKQVVIAHFDCKDVNDSDHNNFILKLKIENLNK